MKTLFLLAALMLLPLAAWAGSPQSIWRSSFTQTSDTTKNLCGNDAGISTNRRGLLHSICISSGTTAASSVSVFNSSGSAINTITIVDGTSKGCLQYDVVATTAAKGLTYSTTGAPAVNILYDCY